MRQRTNFGRFSQSTIVAPEPVAEKAGIVGTVLLAAVAVVLAGGSFFLVSALMKPAPIVDTGPVPELVELAMLHNPEDRVWTEADTDLCKKAVNDQADKDDAFEHRLWSSGRVELPSMAKGYSQGSARLVCELSTKPLRACDSSGKTELVSSLKHYASRTQGFLRQFGITRDLVPAMLGVVALEPTGEASLGFGADLTREAIAKIAGEGFEKVAVAIQPLSEAGVLMPDDFGFMGAGVPALITHMLAAKPARGNACAV